MNNDRDLIRKVTQFLEELGPVQLQAVLRFIRTIRMEPAAATLQGSDLIGNSDFFNVFTGELTFHHALHTTPMTKKSFEYAFERACKAAGWNASVDASATHPGADILVEDVGFSLKTEGAQAIAFDKILISKLRESAGTKGFTDPAQYHSYIQRVLLPHLQEYERIVMLRSFSLARLKKWRAIRIALQMSDDVEAKALQMVNAAAEAGNTVVYMLVEIPVEVLRRIGDLSPEDITLTGTVESARAVIKDDNNADLFTLFFDGSDNKIQVRGLRLDACIVHAAWSIPVESAE